MADELKAGFGRLPGRTKPGSFASLRKTTIRESRAAMAQVIANYSNLIRHLKGVTPQVLQNAMMPVFRRSQIYVPKKSGALMESGELNVYPTTTGAGAEITYGGTKAPYAAIVHEFVWLNHNSPTRAKFLQQAMEEEFDAFLTSMAVDYIAAMR